MVHPFRSDADSAPVQLLSYPPPAAEELTSSWLIRLAVANEVRPSVLTRALGLPQLWTQDMDLAPNMGELAILARAAHLRPEQVIGTSLRPLVEQLNGRVNPLGRNPLLLIAERPRAAQSARGHPVCLECLATTGVVSRAWRFSTTVVCELHRCRLTDVCPRCGVPISLAKPHLERQTRRTLRFPDLRRCSACQEHMHPTAGPEADLSGWTDAVYVQRLVLNAARSGRVVVDGVLLSAQELMCLLGPLLARSDLRGPLTRNMADRLFVKEHGPRQFPEPTGPVLPLEHAPALQRWPVVARTGHLLNEGLLVCLDHLRAFRLTPRQLLGRTTPEQTSTWFRDLAWEALSNLPGGRRLIPLPLQRPPGSVSIPVWRWSSGTAVSPVDLQTSGRTKCSSLWSDLEVLEAFLTRSLTGSFQTTVKGMASHLTSCQRLNEWSGTDQFDSLLQGLIGSLEQDLGGLLPGEPEANRALSDADARLLLALLSPSTLTTCTRLDSRHVPVLWSAGVRMALQRVQELQTAMPSSAPAGAPAPGACIPARFRSRYVK